MITKYPKEIFHADHGKGYALSVEALFYKPISDSQDEGKPDKPLGGYGRFSRLTFTILEPGSATKAVSANMTVDEIAPFLFKLNYAATQHLDAMKHGVSKPISGENEAVAFKLRFKCGKMSGKTPAQVLMEPCGAEQLKSQREWLLSNADRFPANKELIEAIDNAFMLQKEGKLTGNDTKDAESNTPTAFSMKLHDADFKLLTKRAKKLSDFRHDVPNEKGGMTVCPAYTLKLEWDMNFVNPVKVDITNSLSQFKVDGRALAVGDRICEQKKLFRLTFDEALILEASIKRAIRQFEVATAAYTVSLAEKIEEANRTGYRN